jgi:hypothetical protein
LRGSREAFGFQEKTLHSRASGAFFSIQALIPAMPSRKDFTFPQFRSFFSIQDLFPAIQEPSSPGTQEKT